LVQRVDSCERIGADRGLELVSEVRERFAIEFVRVRITQRIGQVARGAVQSVGERRQIARRCVSVGHTCAVEIRDVGAAREIVIGIGREIAGCDRVRHVDHPVERIISIGRVVSTTRPGKRGAVAVGIERVARSQRTRKPRNRRCHRNQPPRRVVR